MTLATRVETMSNNRDFRTLMGELVERATAAGLFTEADLRRLKVVYSGETIELEGEPKPKPKLAWKDESSYAQGERGKVDPKAWGLTLESEPRPGAFRRSSYILVHRYVGCDGWFLTCRDLGLDTRELGDISADEAKQQAVDIVAQAMSARIETLQAHLAQLKAWSDG